MTAPLTRSLAPETAKPVLASSEKVRSNIDLTDQIHPSAVHAAPTLMELQ
ncbi:hypothetical protein [Cryobacterium algoritolerans]|nr:hypothetical protein [Cryobacterium algoritolerans]